MENNEGNESESYQYKLLSAEIKHLRELLSERDKALEMQAGFNEQQKEESNRKIEYLIGRYNKLIGWVAGVSFLIGIGILIYNTLKK